MAKSNLIVMDRVGADAPYVDVVCPSGAYNGDIVVLGDRNSNGTYACAANGAVTDLSMAMILHEDLGYKVEDVSMNTITFATGAIVRALILRVGDKVSIPVGNITATNSVIKDRICVPKASQLPLESLTAFAGTEALGLKIEEIYTHGGVSMARMRVIKTER